MIPTILLIVVVIFYAMGTLLQFIDPNKPAPQSAVNKQSAPEDNDIPSKVPTTTQQSLGKEAPPERIHGVGSNAQRQLHESGKSAAGRVGGKDAPAEIAPNPGIGEQAAPSVSKLPISSYWSHNGSTMGLVVDGGQRTIVYVEIRDGLAGLVKPGSVLFSGTSNGRRFMGRAYRFSKNQPPIEYEVEGPILDNGSKVQLNGLVPIRNSDGRVIKNVEDQLEFSFLRLAK